MQDKFCNYLKFNTQIKRVYKHLTLNFNYARSMDIIKKNKNIIILVGLIFLAVIIYISTSKSSDNKTNDNILEVKIAIQDHKFVPNIVEVPKSTKIRLIVHNEDDTVEV